MSIKPNPFLKFSVQSDVSKQVMALLEGSYAFQSQIVEGCSTSYSEENQRLEFSIIIFKGAPADEKEKLKKSLPESVDVTYEGSPLKVAIVSEERGKAYLC